MTVERKPSAVSAAKARETASGIQWHPGFCSAVAIEFRKNRDVLEFHSELELSKGSLFLDLLVIKKRKDVQTENEIGRIFRTYNICEFKSEDDALTIDDYFKTIAYAGLVKNTGATVNAIPAKELTLTFLRRRYPRELLRALAESGAVITKEYPGVYYIRRGKDGTGDVLFPTQIIVTGELEKETHSSLRILTRGAEEEDIRRFLEEALVYHTKGDRDYVDSILQVSVSANMELFQRIRRDDGMCQALRELMKDEIALDIAEGERRGRREGERRGRRKGRREGRREGRIVEAVNIYRGELGMDDQSIIGKISSKFNLSGDQAKAYVLQKE